LRFISRSSVTPASPAPQISTSRPVAISSARDCGRSMTLRTAKRAPPTSTSVSIRSMTRTPRGTGTRSSGRHDDSSAVTSRLDAAVARTIAWRSRRLVKRHHLV
jgi:hypothetical protein